MKQEPIHPLHTVRSDAGCNTTSPRYVGPLVGNGEISCFLDENGVMHDFQPLAGRPMPRIYWAGRRLKGHQRPMVPFGYFSVAASWEWMESTRWSQRLDMRRGVVTTLHERGKGRDRTETLLMLDRNLIAIRKRVESLKGAGNVSLSYRLCPSGDAGVPEGITMTGGGQDDAGAWISCRLDGVVTHLGRMAVWADRPCQARWNGNEIRLQVPVKTAGDDVTLYVALADDLGDEMFYRHTGSMGRHMDNPMMAQVVHDLHERPVTKGDPEKDLREMREWTARVGWAGVLAQQERLWGDFFGTGWIELPDAPEAQAIWETGMYTTRSQLTRWSIPVAINGSCFNGQYFHDEMAGVQALLTAGHWPLVQRCADFRLSVIPLGMQAVDGAGARNDAACFEGGYFAMFPAGCSIYEVHAGGEPPRLVWNWFRYAGGKPAVLERYYPVFWGAAEFYRRWMVYKEPDGTYTTGACVDFNESIPAVRGGAATMAAAAGSMRLAAQVAEMLGKDKELIPVWREIADGLSRRVQVNSRGMPCQYAGDEGVSFTTLRSVAGAFSSGFVSPLHPGVRKLVEALLKECKLDENWAVACAREPGGAAVSMDARNADPVTWTWTPALAVGVIAQFHDGDLAMKVVDELIRWRGNFACLYECKVMTDGFVSLPWFVTSNAELTASLSSMLIQCEDERIDLLPAIPKGWKDLRFKLAAVNRTTVEVEVKIGKLAALRLAGPAGARTVRIPKRFAPSALLGQPTAEEGEWEEFRVKVGKQRTPNTQHRTSK